MPEPDKSAEREKRKEALRQRLAEQAAVPEQFTVGGVNKLRLFYFALAGLLLIDWIVLGKMPSLAKYRFPIEAVLLIALLTVAVLYPQLSVLGKSFYYRKKWYTFEEIRDIRITGLGRIQIFTSDRMLASFPLNANGAETFIRWARKYGILIRDDRAGIGG